MSRLSLAAVVTLSVDDRMPETALARIAMLDAAQPAQRAWLTPSLGPTASLAFDVLWPAALAGNEFALDDLAWQLGVNPSMAARALHRLVIFRCATPIGADHLALRRWWRNIDADKLATAPSWWRDAHTQTFGGS